MRPSEDLRPWLTVLAAALLAVPLTWAALYVLEAIDILAGPTSIGLGAGLGAMLAIAAVSLRRHSVLLAAVAFPCAWAAGLCGYFLLLLLLGYQAD